MDKTNSFEKSAEKYVETQIEEMKTFKGPSVEEFFASEKLEISQLELTNLTYGTDKRVISKMTANDAIGRAMVATAFMKHYNIKLKKT